MSEPKGPGAAWTEKRSDEGPPPQAARQARWRLKGAPEASGRQSARPNDAANSQATRFTLSRRLVRSEAGSAAVLGGLAVIWIFFEVQNSNFLTARNLTNLVLQTAAWVWCWS